MKTKANNSKPVMICPMVYEMSGEEWHLSHESELHAESIGEFSSKQEASAAVAFMAFCLEHREAIEDVARELIYLCDLERMDGDYTDDDEPSDLRKQQIETAQAIIAHSDKVADTRPASEKTYYAVCHVGGPISRNLGCVTFETALAMISANGREWIDASATDAESDLVFTGEGMDEQDFFDALSAAGLECVHESGVSGDWSIWLRH